MTTPIKGYLSDYSHLLAEGTNPPTTTTTPTDIQEQQTQPQPKDTTIPLQPLNKFVPPCSGVGKVSDIEDIIHNGVCRPRPDKIQWMCSFRRHLIPGEIYRWCQCGKSGDIYCDETCTEEPTRLGPFEFSVVHNVTKHALCGCKCTSHPPFCQGVCGQGGTGVVFQDLGEWIEAHPEDAHRVPWLCQGRDTTNCDQSTQDACSDAGNCLGEDEKKQETNQEGQERAEPV